MGEAIGGRLVKTKEVRGNHSETCISGYAIKNNKGGKQIFLQCLTVSILEAVGRSLNQNSEARCEASPTLLSWQPPSGTIAAVSGCHSVRASIACGARLGLTGRSRVGLLWSLAWTDHTEDHPFADRSLV